MKYLHDILIKCFDNKENTYIVVNIESYSNNFIKSAYRFNRKELFKIKDIFIEGLYIEKFQNSYENEMVSLYYYKNCNLNGKHYCIDSWLSNKNVDFYILDNEEVVI